MRRTPDKGYGYLYTESVSNWVLFFNALDLDSEEK